MDNRFWIYAQFWITFCIYCDAAYNVCVWTLHDSMKILCKWKDINSKRLYSWVAGAYVTNWRYWLLYYQWAALSPPRHLASSYFCPRRLCHFLRLWRPHGLTDSVTREKIKEYGGQGIDTKWILQRFHQIRSQILRRTRRKRRILVRR